MYRILFSIAVLSAAVAPARPDAAADYRKLFGEKERRVNATAATADDAAFAAELFAAAGMVKKQPALRILLLEKTATYGSRDARVLKTTAKALRLLEKLAPEKTRRIAELRLAAARTAYAADRSERNVSAYIDALLAAGDRAAADGETKAARQHYGDALRIAAASAPGRKKGITERIRGLAARVRIGKEEAALRAALQKNPGHTASREKLLYLYLAGQDDPEKAATVLDETLPAALRRRVITANEDPAALSAVQCRDLGDWYRSTVLPVAAPAVRQAVLQKTARYYERFLERHEQKDTARMKAALALKSLRGEIRRHGGPRVFPGAVMIVTFDRKTIQEERGKTVVRDLSGTGNHLRVTGAETVSGRAGTALRFTRGLSVATADHAGATAFSKKDSYTLSVWIKPDDPRAGHRQNVLAKSRDLGGWYGIWISPAGQWCYGAHYGDMTGGRAKEQWHHVILLQDAEKKRRRMIVDGRLVAAGEPFDSAGTGPFTIGGWGRGGTREAFLGAVDELALFNRALTPKELQQLRNFGLEGRSLAD